MKKTLAATSTTAILVTGLFAGAPATADTGVPAATGNVSTSAGSAGFIDIGDGPQYDPIRWLVEQGITRGYADGTFRPGRPISRGEAATFLYRYVDPEFTAPGTSRFTDVGADSAHHPAIAWMHAEQIATGYTDGTFRPNRQITRGEAAKLVYEMSELESVDGDGSSFSDVKPDHPYSAPVGWLKHYGLAHGYADGTFRPGRDITRGEFAKIIWQHEERLQRANRPPVAP